MRSKRLIAAIAGALTLTAGVGAAQAPVSTQESTGASTGGAANASNEQSTGASAHESTEESTRLAGAELDCRETANTYKDKNRIYLYARSYCAGGNDAWAPAKEDADYGDTQGPIQNFDNKADSIVNTTKQHVAFYNEPNFKDDNFCLRPGNYIRRLYVYGDGGGTNDWWSNSISSHKLVDPNDCDRWYGWLVS